MESKRTQADRTAATRAALMTAGRSLFAERGYADVGTDEIARSAGVTRGALYHQFGGKLELFAAVFEEVEGELSDAIGARLAQADESEPFGLIRDGIDAWLASSADPVVQRIALIEAPAALGWARWREIGQRHGVGLLQSAVAGAMAAGAIVEQPTLPLAHVLSGALEEAVLYAARADEPDVAREQVRGVLVRLLGGLVPGPGGSGASS